MTAAGVPIPEPAMNCVVTVIVPCRNESRFIEAFLADLLGQEGVPGPWEILVADGMSTDGTRNILEAASAREAHLRIIENPEGIVSTGLNRAIEAASGAVVLRMDVHSQYAPDYIASCLEVLDQTGADNVGGAARVRPGKGWGEAIAVAYASPFAVGGASFHFPDQEGWVDTVPYGCWRRTTLEELGGFDEDLVRNQDDELNLRLVRNGGRIWQSARIRSWYVPRDDLGSLFRQYFQYGYWKIAVIRKHGTPASYRHLVPGLFVGALVTLGILGVVSGLARTLWWILAGMYGLFVGGGSVRLAARGGWHLIWRLPVVLATFHLSYGFGTLAGLWGNRKIRQGKWTSGLTR